MNGGAGRAPQGDKNGPDAGGAYSTTVTLDPGTHEYKFLIDGESFREDPGNPDSTGFFHNSLIRLP